MSPFFAAMECTSPNNSEMKIRGALVDFNSIF